MFTLESDIFDSERSFAKIHSLFSVNVPSYSSRILVSDVPGKNWWTVYFDGKCCMTQVGDAILRDELDALSELFGLER